MKKAQQLVPPVKWYYAPSNKLDPLAVNPQIVVFELTSHLFKPIPFVTQQKYLTIAPSDFSKYFASGFSCDISTIKSAAEESTRDFNKHARH
eukprot:scaffold109584_cov23-Cyclotella_meneghiniana.AAC.2